MQAGNRIVKAGQRQTFRKTLCALIGGILKRKRRNRERRARGRNENVASSIYGYVCQSRRLLESRVTRVPTRDTTF